MKTLLTTIGILFVLFGYAQETHPDLITDRPDQTESSSVVPFKTLQIETGFIVENKVSGNIKQKSITNNTTLLRYGLLDNFELRLGLDQISDQIKIGTRDSLNTSGLSPLYTGFKIGITEEDGWLPEIAFLGGIVHPFSASDEFKTAHTAVNMRFSLAHTLSDRLSLGYNFGVEWDGDTPIPGYYYSVAIDATLTGKLGMYIENYGLIYEEGEAEHLFDAGFTYLVLPKLQFDISGGFGISSEAIDNFIVFGLSYRIPH